MILSIQIGILICLIVNTVTNVVFSVYAHRRDKYAWMHYSEPAIKCMEISADKNLADMHRETLREKYKVSENILLRDLVATNLFVHAGMDESKAFQEAEKFVKHAISVKGKIE